MHVLYMNVVHSVEQIERYLNRSIAYMELICDFPCKKKLRNSCVDGSFISSIDFNRECVEHYFTRRETHQTH